MAIRLYAICAGRPGPPAPAGVPAVPDVPGVEGAPLRLVHSNGLAALISDAATRGEDEQALWEHERAVEALMSGGDVLPVRFGTLLASEREAEAMLAARASELRSMLARVAGAHELAVRAFWQEAAPKRAHSGTAYMRARAAMTGNGQRLVELLERTLGALSREARVRVAAHPRGTVTGAFLVRRDETPAFAAALERLNATLEEASLVCTGPWPPYSFVQGHPA